MTARSHRILAVGWFVWLATSGVTFAHHGFANFDLNTEITLSGTITDLALINPHSWLYIDVTGADGTVTRWKCELRGASVLRRSGWTAEMFAPGTTITITGAPDRFTANTCYLGTAIFADGTRVDRYGQIKRARSLVNDVAARTPSGRPNFAGDWAAEQRRLTDPRGMVGAFLPLSVADTLEPGAVPEGTQAFPGARGTEVSLAKDPIGAFWNRPSALPLTEAGARAIEGFDGASTDNPRLRCEATNILFDWSFESDVNRIMQTDETITLLYGSMAIERTVHLTMTEHPADLTPSRAGYSIGRWEGDVLVVDTIGFLPGILSADGRLPHSDRLHVVERFSLDPKQRALVRTYTAEDPQYFEGQYKGSDTVLPADVPYEVLPCDDRGYRSDTSAGGEARARSSWVPLPVWVAVGLLSVMFAWVAIRQLPRA